MSIQDDLREWVDHPSGVGLMREAADRIDALEAEDREWRRLAERLVRQAESLSEDRVTRNARIDTLETALHEAWRWYLVGNLKMLEQTLRPFARVALGDADA